MEYIKARGIRYANELPTIRKKKDAPLQSVFEAFTNAWEAIREKYSDEHLNRGTITLELYCISNATSSENGIYDFDKLCVVDNGVGLNDASYERLINLRDDSKHFSNKGTGRIQYIHTFDETVIESVYKKDNGIFCKRKVTLSKKEAFISKNAIMRLDEEAEVHAADSNTIVTFLRPLEGNDTYYFQTLNIDVLKEEIIKHFLSLFCDNRTILPHIKLIYYIDNTEEDSKEILTEDIPEPNKEETFTIPYSQLDKNKVVHSSRVENFTLKAFVQPETNLKENAIYLVSKGERASSIKLEKLASKDSVAGNRYLFLLSSSYIDNHDRDDRGNIQLVSTKDFRKQEEGSLFPAEMILLEDIQAETNKTIDTLYSEIEEKTSETRKKLEELQRMFLLNPNTVAALKNKIKNTDTDEDILMKVYQSDAEIKAKQDAQIKQQLNDIESLLPTDPNYQQKLAEKVNDFVTSIPLQNRTALSQYVAHRKLVLEIFGNIMHQVELGEDLNENILHNLIFQEGSSTSENSDLWLINEEFIYFKGNSNQRLCDIEYNGEQILKQELTQEEQDYKNKCHHDGGIRKPDILLFPEEGKCIIIEFKAPKVEVSNHLHQINRYARLIHNLSQDKYKFTTYYGYLIGENIDIDDILDSIDNFVSASSFNYIFRPYVAIKGKFGRPDGALYTEIIKYSDLLERAKLRNRIFIEKLEKGND